MKAKLYLIATWWFLSLYAVCGFAEGFVESIGDADKTATAVTGLVLSFVSLFVSTLFCNKVAKELPDVKGGEE